MSKKKKPTRLKRGFLTPEDLANSRPGPIVHSELDALGTEWIRNLFKRVGHMRCPTFEQWELIFMREANYRREIMVWEAVARTFEECLTEWPDIDKQQLEAMVCFISTGSTFNPETDQHRRVREVFLRHWEQAQQEPQRIVREVAAQIGFDLEK